MGILNRIFKRNKAKEVWNELFCPDPCPWCKGRKVMGRMLDIHGESMAGLHCLDCDAQWVRGSNAEISAFRRKLTWKETEYAMKVYNKKKKK